MEYIDTRVHTLPTIQQRVEVRFDYPVEFTRGLFRIDNLILVKTIAAHTSQPQKILCVIDEGVVNANPSLIAEIQAYADAHDDSLTLTRDPIIVTGGEASKNQPELVKQVQDAVHEDGIDRHSYVMAIGGGAVIDMVGYAAATAHRGVRLLRVPTTVLAQNDAAVGVKNSMNAYGKKNFIGTFAPPYAVLNDFDFLHTLEDRDWLAGISEAVKVALLKDADFFAYMEDNADALAQRHDEPMEWVVYRCAELHLEHIATSGDPFELGSSRPLDFGHWAAHKLEQLTDYELRHGEAVGIGICLDVTYSYLKGMIDQAAWQRVLNLFVELGMAIYTPELGDTFHDENGVLAGLREFREHLGGRLTIMLLEDIGRGVEVHHMDADILEDAIHLLKKEASA